MDKIYTDKCRYESQQQKESSGTVYRHIPANLEPAYWRCVSILNYIKRYKFEDVYES
jgi:hypothetical protein